MFEKWEVIHIFFFTQINDINYVFLIDKKVKDGYDYPKIFSYIIVLIHHYLMVLYLKQN